MKKKIIATALIATMVLSLTACGGNEEVEQSNSDANESQTTVQEETGNIEETVVGEVNRDIPFWILQQDFSIPQKEFEGTLYNETMTMPLDLTTLDEYSTSYCWSPNGERTYVNSIVEMLTSENCVLNPSESIYIRTQYDEDGEYYSSQFDESFCGIGYIVIYNMDITDTLSIKQCYENGWWEIVQNENANHAKTLQVAKGDGDEILSSFLEKVGSPTYIADMFNSYNSLDTYLASMEENSVVMYHIICEYEDFTFVIGVTESSFGSTPNVTLEETRYYPSGMWEFKKNEFVSRLLPVK